MKGVQVGNGCPKIIIKIIKRSPYAGKEKKKKKNKQTDILYLRAVLPCLIGDGR